MAVIAETADEVVICNREAFAAVPAPNRRKKAPLCAGHKAMLDSGADVRYDTGKK